MGISPMTDRTFAGSRTAPCTWATALKRANPFPFGSERQEGIYKGEDFPGPTSVHNAPPQPRCRRGQTPVKLRSRRDKPSPPRIPLIRTKVLSCRSAKPPERDKWCDGGTTSPTPCRRRNTRSRTPVRGEGDNKGLVPTEHRMKASDGGSQRTRAVSESGIGSHMTIHNIFS